MASILLPRELKATYSEIIPVLSGRGNEAPLTLFGRRRNNPAKPEPILSQPWKAGEEIHILWMRQQEPAADLQTAE